MIQVGERLPEGVFKVKDDQGVAVDVPVSDVFAGKKVVMIGLPGAFTSTCHNAHIPQFVANADAIKGRGVDAIVVMATNDHHVMKAWAEVLDPDGKLNFVADGVGNFTRALGMEVDLSAGGLGKRCKRFSALVDDGTVTVLNFEPEGSKGISATGAAAMIEALG